MISRLLSLLHFHIPLFIPRCILKCDAYAICLAAEADSLLCLIIAQSEHSENMNSPVSLI